jgi:hypothetical protein
LPPVALPDDEAVAINNLLGGLASEAGITTESYTQARLLSQTPLGSLYLIPGTLGACVVLAAQFASCGDPGAEGTPLLALATVTPANVLVGGGIAAEGARRIVVSSGGRPIGDAQVVRGVFRITQNEQIDARDGLQFSAN